MGGGRSGLDRQRAEAVFAVETALVASGVIKLDDAEELGKADDPVLGVVVAGVWGAVLISVARGISVFGSDAARIRARIIKLYYPNYF